MCFQCTEWAHCGYFVHFLTVYLQCSSSGHWILPPVWGDDEGDEDAGEDDGGATMTKTGSNCKDWSGEDSEDEDEDYDEDEGS